MCTKIGKLFKTWSHYHSCLFCLFFFFFFLVPVIVTFEAVLSPQQSQSGILDNSWLSHFYTSTASYINIMFYQSGTCVVPDKSTLKSSSHTDGLHWHSFCMLFTLDFPHFQTFEYSDPYIASFYIFSFCLSNCFCLYCSFQNYWLIGFDRIFKIQK